MEKLVIVVTNMLESMIDHPTPTRAKVSDIAIAVQEGADGIMLSSETAHGKFPLKAVKVMRTVALRTESSLSSSISHSILSTAIWVSIFLSFKLNEKVELEALNVYWKAVTTWSNQMG